MLLQARSHYHMHTVAEGFFGAGCQTRTDDLSLTRRLLYQLS